MTFICPPVDYDSPAPHEENLSRERLRACVISVQESMRAARELERQMADQRNRSISFRLQKDRLDRLDAVAESAATTRGQMIRQIIAAYLSYIDEHEISYKGSLI
jgi:hypothetical protein